MPIGVIVVVLAVVSGGLIGSVLGNRLPENIKTQMNSIFGLCSICMGVSAVMLMKNMPAVVLSMLVGTLIGLVLHIGLGIQKGCSSVLNRVMKNADKEINDLMLTAVVLFCASGTGIYGALDAGMTGNHSVLLTKAMLDFFCSMIFACKLGKATSFIGIPQFVVLISLFLLAKVIVPMTTDVMICDFKACGGFILVATGLRILQLKMFPVADMLPAMVLVMPISYAWTTWILPLVS